MFSDEKYSRYPNIGPTKKKKKSISKPQWQLLLFRKWHQIVRNFRYLTTLTNFLFQMFYLIERDKRKETSFGSLTHMKKVNRSQIMGKIGTGSLWNMIQKSITEDVMSCVVSAEFFRFSTYNWILIQSAKKVFEHLR